MDCLNKLVKEKTAAIISIFFKKIAVEKSLFYYNLGQNTVEKSAKLSNIGFSMKYFTVGFSQFCSAVIKICLVVGKISSQFHVVQELP